MISPHRQFAQKPVTFKNIPSGDSSPRQLAQSTAWSNGRRLCKGTVDILKVAMRKNVSFSIHWIISYGKWITISMYNVDGLFYTPEGNTLYWRQTWAVHPLSWGRHLEPSPSRIYFFSVFTPSCWYELSFSYYYLDGQAILQVQHARLANVFQLCTGLAHLGNKVVKKQAKINPKRYYDVGWTSVTNK